MSRLQPPEDSVVISVKDVLGQESEDDDAGAPQNLMDLDLEFSDYQGDSDNLENHDDAEKDDVTEDEPEEFNLFGTASKVRLASPEIEDERVGMKRPDQYYFAKYTEQEKYNFKSVAIEGDQILAQSQQKDLYPAMQLPRKVLDYTQLAQRAKQERIRARRRPGKKSRLLRRTKREQSQSHLKRTKPMRPQPSYGADRLYTNSNLNRQNSGNKSRNKKGVRGVSGKGGHPRKGAKK